MTDEDILSQIPDWVIAMSHDPQIEPEFLPPPTVLAAIHGVAGPDDLEHARRWLADRPANVARADDLLARLDAEHPLALTGGATLELPAWAGKPWAMLLNVEWGRDLPQAIEDAEAWLASHPAP